MKTHLLAAVAAFSLISGGAAFAQMQNQPSSQSPAPAGTAMTPPAASSMSSGSNMSTTSGMDSTASPPATTADGATSTTGTSTSATAAAPASDSSMSSGSSMNSSGAMASGSSMPASGGGMAMAAPTTTANTPAGEAPTAYPKCTKRGQDRCIANQATSSHKKHG